MKGNLASRLGFRTLLAAVIGAGVVGMGISPGWSQSDDPGRGVALGEAQRQEFIHPIQRRLKALDERLMALAWQVIQDKDPARDLRDQLMKARFDEKKAEADYLNAKLTREVAEIAVKEYKEGIFVQELTTVEGEITLAHQGLERSRAQVETAKDRQARIKEVADERTAFGRMINYDYADKLDRAKLELEKAKAEVEAAEGKKKVLLEYTRPKNTKELEAEVKKAHSDELARQAGWELQKVMVVKLEKATEAPWPKSAIGKRLLALLDGAMPIQEKAHAKLDEFRNAEKSDATFSKEIDALTNELEALIEDAEAARAAAAFDGLRSRLKRATRQ